MRSFSLSAALLVTVFPALAGPYDQPYALVESGWRSAVRRELPIYLHTVDGKAPVNKRRSDLSPGKHQIDVYLPTRVGPTTKQHRIVEIDAAACMRYRIVAHYDNLTHIEWTPVVYSERVGECERKFRPRG